MSRPAARYAAGVAVVALAALAVTLRVSQPARGQAWAGAALGLIAQAPLGWLLVRGVGTERFLPLWGAGLLIRLGLLAAAALLLIPLLGWAREPMMLSLAGVLLALLFVEGFAALADHPLGK